MRLIKTAIDRARLGASDDDLLLGAWCLKGSADIIAESKIYNILPYHWDNRDKYHDDYVDLSKMYEKILSSLVLVLNSTHGIERDVRYWRIVVGPWLRFFTDAVFDRYECIRLAKENSPNSYCKVYSYNLTDWCPADFSEFWSDLTSEEWNEVIFSECVKFQKIPFKSADECLLPVRTDIKKRFSLITRCKDGLKWLISKYSEVIGTNYQGTLLVGAYVPVRKTLKLYLGLSQIPFFLLPILKIKGSKLNQELRASINISSNTVAFEDLINNLLPIFMPKAYLEDFAEYRTKILDKFPQKPGSIFTANSYQADDVFKIWAAEKVALGVPLVLGQHGGTFSIARHNQTVDHQFHISDHFVSWGWGKHKEVCATRLPSIQLCDRSEIIADTEGNILLVETSLPRYFYCHYSVPIAGQFVAYLQDQLAFIERLEPVIINNLKIRLDPTLSSRGWDVQGLMDEAGYTPKVDKSDLTILQALKTSRICICTSNSTVFLETLSLNFPTIVFWDPEFNEINQDAQPYIDSLVKAEILFFHPAEAARHVNKLASNVNDWWFSEKVQSAREIFCARYALTSNDWVDEWSDFLLGVQEDS